METITLNNGITLPALGLGVYQSSPEETADAVATALGLGYRHVDTAAAYFNEKEVGDGLRRAGLPRDSVFVETKVFPSDYGFEETLHAFEKSTRKLGVDHLDLFILHQPRPSQFERTLAAYRALEKLLAEGSVRAIGVSNFSPDHLRRLLAEVDVVPAVNQIELHPYFQQPDVQAADAEHGILTQAWSPIGGITFYPGPWREDRKNVMRDPAIAAIAETHAKSPAQVMLRWGIQQGRSVIPKSTNPGRLAQNLDVFDFTLTDDEMSRIDALDTGKRTGVDPDEPRGDFYDRPIPEA
ncbi:aldo/keto reductase [Streptomyces parvulus]|uniref:Aldo/keto reductase n=1 Tax=Streptomyces parvulus TaxID=146923 RepID=A0A369V1K7_9ACTN|nr:aldo/keto reductase [Streptomyces parvulus]RDD86671.1 aldo/keto reductase [Streptomyces parvulus]